MLEEPVSKDDENRVKTGDDSRQQSNIDTDYTIKQTYKLALPFPQYLENDMLKL